MHLRNALALLFASSLLAACGPTAQAPFSQSAQDQAATIVAQTLASGSVTTLASAIPGATPFASPVSQKTGVPVTGTSLTPASSATVTVTVTVTPTGAKAMLTMTGSSFCRSGPGASFKQITGFTAGAKLEIVGRNTENNYWQVKLPNSTETCWVWGQYATTSGDVENIPTSAAVLSASGSALPTRPGSMHFQYTCSFGNLTTELSWSDSADNETGYRVYRFDNLIADLPANATSYTDNTQSSAGSALQYSVEAYNDAGSSQKRTITFTCQ